MGWFDVPVLIDGMGGCIEALTSPTIEDMAADDEVAIEWARACWATSLSLDMEYCAPEVNKPVVLLFTAPMLAL